MKCTCEYREIKNSSVEPKECLFLIDLTCPVHKVTYEYMERLMLPGETLGTEISRELLTIIEYKRQFINPNF